MRQQMSTIGGNPSTGQRMDIVKITVDEHYAFRAFKQHDHECEQLDTSGTEMVMCGFHQSDIGKDQSMSMNTFRTTMRTSAWNADDVREDDDIISMIIIMKDEKYPNGQPMQTLQSSMMAASHAMLSLFASLEGIPEQYRNLFKAWVDGRIRKVVKHAKASRFQSIRTLLDDHGFPYGFGEVDGSAALVLCPLHASSQHEDWFRPIHRLQLQGYHVLVGAVSDDDHSRLVVTVNDSLDMSEGKSIAQFLHAVQVAITDIDDEDYRQWEHDGFMTYPILGAPDADEPVVIHDAGFTEIPANSFTASAMLI